MGTRQNVARGVGLQSAGSFRATAAGRSRGICTFAFTLLVACSSPEQKKLDTAVAAPAPVPAAPAGIAPIFAADQAKAGQKVYFAECVRCHTADRFVGPQFTTAWNTRRVYDLYDIVSSTMPQDTPGSLTQQQYLDVVAFMLQINGAKAGQVKLTTDADSLKKMRIGTTSTSE